MDQEAKPAPSTNIPPIPIRRGPGRPPKDPNAVKPAPLPKRSNEEWQEEVANAWLGLWILIKLVASLFGFQEKAPGLTAEEAREDAVTLTPIVQKYPTLTKFVSWIAAPIVVINRIRTKFERKAKAPKENRPNEPLRSVPAPR